MEGLGNSIYYILTILRQTILLIKFFRVIFRSYRYLFNWKLYGKLLVIDTSYTIDYRNLN